MPARFTPLNLGARFTPYVMPARVPIPAPAAAPVSKPKPKPAPETKGADDDDDEVAADGEQVVALRIVTPPDWKPRKETYKLGSLLSYMATHNNCEPKYGRPLSDQQIQRVRRMAKKANGANPSLVTQRRRTQTLSPQLGGLLPRGTAQVHPDTYHHIFGTKEPKDAVARVKNFSQTAFVIVEKNPKIGETRILLSPTENLYFANATVHVASVELPTATSVGVVPSPHRPVRADDAAKVAAILNALPSAVLRENQIVGPDRARQYEILRLEPVAVAMRPTDGGFTAAQVRFEHTAV